MKNINNVNKCEIVEIDMIDEDSEKEFYDFCKRIVRVCKDEDIKVSEVVKYINELDNRLNNGESLDILRIYWECEWKMKNVKELIKDGIDRYDGFGSGYSMCGNVERILIENKDSGYSIDELVDMMGIDKKVLGRSVYRLVYKGRIKRKYIENVGYYYSEVKKWCVGGVIKGLSVMMS